MDNLRITIDRRDGNGEVTEVLFDRFITGSIKSLSDQSKEDFRQTTLSNIAEILYEYMQG